MKKYINFIVLFIITILIGIISINLYNKPKFDNNIPKEEQLSMQDKEIKSEKQVTRINSQEKSKPNLNNQKIETNINNSKVETNINNENNSEEIDVSKKNTTQETTEEIDKNIKNNSNINTNETNLSTNSNENYNTNTIDVTTTDSNKSITIPNSSNQNQKSISSSSKSNSDYIILEVDSSDPLPPQQEEPKTQKSQSPLPETTTTSNEFIEIKTETTSTINNQGTDSSNNSIPNSTTPITSPGPTPNTQSTNNSSDNITDSISSTTNPNSNGNNLSNLETAKSYKSLKIMKTITTSNLKKAITVQGKDNVTIAQSFCTTEKYYITALINKSNTKNLIQVYDKKTGKKLNEITDNFHHANGMTYNQETKEIYIVHNEDSKYSTFSVNNIQKKSKLNKVTKNAPRSISGIAYDNTTNQYYLSKGSHVYIYDNNFNQIRKIKKIRTGTTQDIGAYKGIILVIVYQSKSTTSNNAVDMYRASDGAYLGSYNINTPKLELESIDYYGNNKFALYFNNLGSKNNYIYTTTEFNLK